MATALLRRLSFGQKRSFLKVDRSAISLPHIPSKLRELAGDLLGFPMPPPPHVWRWCRVDVNEISRKNATDTANRSRFLIRAVIYDIPCFIHPPKTKTEKNVDQMVNGEMGSVQAVLSGRDWSNVIHLDHKEIANAATSPDIPTVTAAEVAQRLGVGNIPGLQQMTAGSNKITWQSKLEEKQKLESILGTRDSVRAKYMEKIRQKKMMAEARRERDRFGINPLPVPPTGPSDKAWNVTPGSPALVRYLEERGISQALIARGDQSLLNDLLEKLGNYKFQHIKNLEISKTMEKSTEEVTKAANHYLEILNNICAIWGLHPWQVLLVIGDSAHDEALQKAILGSQVFVCKVRNPSCPEDSFYGHNVSVSHARHLKGGELNRGLFNWFKRLYEGTLHENGVVGRAEHNSKDKAVYFKVIDMTQLKWIIEDMNGVSYKSSTFVQGFH